MPGRWAGATSSWSILGDRARSVDFIAKCEGPLLGGFVWGRNTHSVM